MAEGSNFLLFSTPFPPSPYGLSFYGKTSVVQQIHGLVAVYGIEQWRKIFIFGLKQNKKYLLLGIFFYYYLSTKSLIFYPQSPGLKAMELKVLGFLEELLGESHIFSWIFQRIFLCDWKEVFLPKAYDLVGEDKCVRNAKSLKEGDMGICSTERKNLKHLVFLSLVNFKGSGTFKM